MNLTKFALYMFSMTMLITSAFKFNFKVLSSKRNMSMSSNIKEIITKSIGDNNVMVFSKTYCPYCSKCKSTLDGLNIKYGLIELDVSKDGAAIQAELLAMTGQRTVPSVFVKGKHIGGNDDTQAAIKSGTFQAALNA